MKFIDEDLINQAIDDWNSSNTSNLPSPDQLEEASKNIAQRTGRSRIVLSRDPQGNSVLTRDDLEKMQQQANNTVKEERKIKDDYIAIWDAVQETYDRKSS